MKYVSETFEKKLNRIIRPAFSMSFAIGASVEPKTLNIFAIADSFDENVAPIIEPTVCTNDYYYAVIGADSYVGDNRRICAPDKVNGEFPTPTHGVPWGITPITTTSNWAVIGNDTANMNFIITDTVELNFLGGHSPEYLMVEYYDTSTSSWVEETTIENPLFAESIYYTPDSAYNSKYRRFKVKNTTEQGCFQLNYIRVANNYSEWGNPFEFINNQIVSVAIDEETDLTSQTLPSYEMTVVCLDTNGLLNPDDDNNGYWSKTFKTGSPCFFKAGYAVSGEVEYLPLFFGNLTASPTYNEGKLTFKVAVIWNEEVYYGGELPLQSLYNGGASVGDETSSRDFNEILRVTQAYDSYDGVFHNMDDITDSKCNYYANLNQDEFRQLIANALGCYVTAGIKTVDLHNSNDIQYREANGGIVARFDQVQNMLESQPNVKNIVVSRNANTVSADYVDVEANERVTVGLSATEIDFNVPFFAFGKVEIVDAQADDPSVAVSITTLEKEVELPNGYTQITLMFSANGEVSIKPIVRFYRVDTTQFEETKTVDYNASEDYINDNILITNSYVANKVKRVAEFVSSAANKYEVDVVQNIRHEIGDVIRLETKTGVYNTCVITGLKFNLPGSNGHITCRKIFSLLDSAYTVEGIINSIFVSTSDYWNGYSLRLLTAYDDSIVVGLYTNGGHNYFVIAGAKTVEKAINYLKTTLTPNVEITDVNLHTWGVIVIEIKEDNSYTIPVMDLGAYDSTTGVVDHEAWGAMTLIMKLYKEQNMKCPVSYSSEYSIISE